MQKQNEIKPVMGLRVEVDQLKPQIIQVDQTFQKCPIAHAAGIPLYVKRLLNQPRKKGQNYIIVRMMSDPQIGLAPIEWQYGGILPPAPPVLVARSDSIQFTHSDWALLDDFQIAMLDDGPRKVQRKDFVQFVKLGYQNTSNIALQALFPKGNKYKIDGLLNRKDLNDKIGESNGVYNNQRVGIKFLQSKQDYAIKPCNLKKL